MSINIDPFEITEPIHRDSPPSWRTTPTDYQCYVLRAMSLGDRLFVEVRKEEKTQDWQIYGEKSCSSPEGEKLKRIRHDVIMSGGMEPEICDVRFLERLGYVQQAGQEYTLTDKGLALVKERGSFKPPKEFAEEEVEL